MKTFRFQHVNTIQKTITVLKIVYNIQCKDLLQKGKLTSCYMCMNIQTNTGKY